MNKLNGRHYNITIQDEAGDKLTMELLTDAVNKLRAVEERRKEKEQQRVWGIVIDLFKSDQISKDQFISDARAYMGMDNFQIVKVIREKERSL